MSNRVLEVNDYADTLEIYHYNLCDQIFREQEKCRETDLAFL